MGMTWRASRAGGRRACTDRPGAGGCSDANRPLMFCIAGTAMSPQCLAGGGRDTVAATRTP